jgi:hypothetical protein
MKGSITRKRRNLRGGVTPFHLNKVTKYCSIHHNKSKTNCAPSTLKILQVANPLQASLLSRITAKHETGFAPQDIKYILSTKGTPGEIGLLRFENTPTIRKQLEIILYKLLSEGGAEDMTTGLYSKIQYKVDGSAHAIALMKNKNKVRVIDNQVKRNMPFQQYFNNDFIESVAIYVDVYSSLFKKYFTSEWVKKHSLLIYINTRGQWEHRQAMDEHNIYDCNNEFTELYGNYQLKLIMLLDIQTHAKELIQKILDYMDEKSTVQDVIHKYTILKQKRELLQSKYTLNSEQPDRIKLLGDHDELIRKAGIVVETEYLQRGFTCQDAVDQYEMKDDRLNKVMNDVSMLLQIGLTPSQVEDADYMNDNVYVKLEEIDTIINHLIAINEQDTPIEPLAFSASNPDSTPMSRRKTPRSITKTPSLKRSRGPV